MDHRRKSISFILALFIVLVMILYWLADQKIWACHEGFGQKHCHRQCFVVEEMCIEGMGCINKESCARLFWTDHIH